MFNLIATKNRATVAVSSLNDYFFSLNKWPIDKAPKVSNSSYLVGVWFVLLFHFYAFSSFEHFVFLKLSLFSLGFQIFFVVVLLTLLILLSGRGSAAVFGSYLVLPAVVTLAIFFYFSFHVNVSSYYTEANFAVSSSLIINLDFFIFLFFFFGWVLKLNKKYSVESFTKNENLLFRTVLPTIYFFELFAFVYCLIWRFMNTTMVGLSTVMYLPFYKWQFLSGALLTKMFFYSSCFVFIPGLVAYQKNSTGGASVAIFFLFFLYLTLFLFKEFGEFLVMTHQSASANQIKFTYIKFFVFITFFNFVHAYIVIFFTLVIAVIALSKNQNVADSFELLYATNKNFYFLMALTAALFTSVYLVSNLGVYGGTFV